MNQKFNLVQLEPYESMLAKAKVNNLSTAEKADIVSVLKDTDIDYCIALEFTTPILREIEGFISYKLEATISMPFKVIDIRNNKYLYNGRLVEKHTRTNVAHTESVVYGAIDKTLPQVKKIIFD